MSSINRIGLGSSDNKKPHAKVTARHGGRSVTKGQRQSSKLSRLFGIFKKQPELIITGKANKVVQESASPKTIISEIYTTENSFHENLIKMKDLWEIIAKYEKYDPIMGKILKNINEMEKASENVMNDLLLITQQYNEKRINVNEVSFHIKNSFDSNNYFGILSNLVLYHKELEMRSPQNIANLVKNTPDVKFRRELLNKITEDYTVKIKKSEKVYAGPFPSKFLLSKDYVNMVDYTFTGELSLNIFMQRFTRWPLLIAKWETSSKGENALSKKLSDKLKETNNYATEIEISINKSFEARLEAYIKKNHLEDKTEIEKLKAGRTFLNKQKLNLTKKLASFRKTFYSKKKKTEMVEKLHNTEIYLRIIADRLKKT